MEQAYCNTCKMTIYGDDIIQGRTISEDEYTNPRCGECGNEDIIEIDESELCWNCGHYHADDYDYRYCAEEIMREGVSWQALALRWIGATVGLDEAAAWMARNAKGLEDWVMADPRGFIEFQREQYDAEMEQPPYWMTARMATQPCAKGA